MMRMTGGSFFASTPQGEAESDASLGPAERRRRRRKCARAVKRAFNRAVEEAEMWRVVYPTYNQAAARAAIAEAAKTEDAALLFRQYVEVCFRAFRSRLEKRGTPLGGINNDPNTDAR